VRFLILVLTSKCSAWLHISLLIKAVKATLIFSDTFSGSCDNGACNLSKNVCVIFAS
jgi:hypothetical protein